jgi:hypothetical protein
LNEELGNTYVVRDRNFIVWLEVRESQRSLASSDSTYVLLEPRSTFTVVGFEGEGTDRVFYMLLEDGRTVKSRKDYLEQHSDRVSANSE